MTSNDIDNLVKELVLNEELDKKDKIFGQIYKQAGEKGIYPCSIQAFYEARGRGEFGGFTVPAINLRCLTYDLACAIFRVAKKNNAGAFIFEIAKSEIGYTAQRPIEYAGVCFAGAIREGWQGAVFIQGDHFQIKEKNFKANPQKEIQTLKDLIREAVAASFFNIDIDSSTLVDLSKSNVLQQQKDNYKVCAELTEYIRSIQPKGVEVSVGGEIGEVGGKNSTPEELEAFMDGYRAELGKSRGISKISIQTGTSHGGVVLPDGSIARVKIDFSTLEELSRLAREKYGLAGCVQHGASTLPKEAFHRFPETGTAEVHLATEFQNMVYESRHFPSELRERMYSWIEENCRDERGENQTQEQFIYKTRKKALGPFKHEIMNISREIRKAIAGEVEERFDFLFKQLNVVDTKDLVDRYIKPIELDERKRGAFSKVSGSDLEGAD